MNRPTNSMMIEGTGAEANRAHGDRLIAAVTALAIIVAVAISGCAQRADTANTTSGETSPATNGNAPAAVKSQTVFTDVFEPTVGNWPVFRGNAEATGVATSALPERLELLWKREYEDGAFDSTAAIVDGTVYVGCLDGHFYAVDLKTGDEKWKFKTDLGFRAPPAVRDGVVYVGDEDGRFFAIDAATGELKWSHETLAEIDAGANFYGETVVIGSQDATLYCFGLESGEPIWKYAIDDMIRCSPTIVGERTFIAGCDARLHIIDLNDGQETAAVDLFSPTGATPAAMGDRLYVGVEDGIFYCIDWKKAEIVWAYQHPTRHFAFRASAAVTEDAIYLGGRDKMMRELNPENGDAVWSFTTRGRIDSSPVVVGERLFFGSADGRLFALNRRTGEEIWQYDAGDGFIASPAVADGRLVIGNDDGVLFCFGAPP